MIQYYNKKTQRTNSNLEILLSIEFIKTTYLYLSVTFYITLH